VGVLGSGGPWWGCALGFVAGAEPPHPPLCFGSTCRSGRSSTGTRRRAPSSASRSDRSGQCSHGLVRLSLVPHDSWPQGTRIPTLCLTPRHRAVQRCILSHAGSPGPVPQDLEGDAEVGVLDPHRRGGGLLSPARPATPRQFGRSHLGGAVGGGMGG